MRKDLRASVLLVSFYGLFLTVLLGGVTINTNREFSLAMFISAGCIWILGASLSD